VGCGEGTPWTWLSGMGNFSSSSNQNKTEGAGCGEGTSVTGCRVREFFFFIKTTKTDGGAKQ